MKRFYTLVSTKKSGAGCDILLDGKVVNTPYKNALRAPNEALANEIMKEWSAQKEQILPDTMPLTQILSTKIDRIPLERDAMSASALKYFDTDLLCYRAAEPPEIKAAQEDAWDPVLEWFTARFGEGIKTTDNLIAVRHAQNLHVAVREYVEHLDDDHFTILQLVTASAGSIILAIALLERHINAEKIFALTHIEENFKAALYNEEKYGADPAQEKKDKAMLVDLTASEKYLALIKS